MEPADFVAPETGNLIRTIEKQFAFVPAPLPPKIDLGAIALKMSEAMHALGELKGASADFTTIACSYDLFSATKR